MGRCVWLGMADMRRLGAWARPCPYNRSEPMDDKHLRKLRQAVEDVITEREAQEYLAGARSEPRPEDFGLDATAVRTIERRKERVFAWTLGVGVVLSVPLGLVWAYDAFPSTFIDWMGMAFVGYLIGFAAVMLLAVASFLLTPIWRVILPRWAAASAFEAALAEFKSWKHRTFRSYWRSLSPTGFEEEVGRVYRGLGYKVATTPRTGDKGVDLVLRDGGRTGIVQCKAHHKPIGPGPVRELIGARLSTGADYALLASRSGFTSGAKELAREQAIELVDLDQLLHSLRGQ